MERESSVKISATVYKQLEEQSKSVAYTDNGTYNVIPDPGYWLSNVNVEVHVDLNLSVISELSAVISGLNDLIATITSLTINENGTYTPPEGVLGYKSIDVNVAGGGVEGDFGYISSLSIYVPNNEPLPELYYPMFNNIRAFSIRGNINSVAFPEGTLTYVNWLSSTFYTCSKLTSVIFPEGALTNVTYMYLTFESCTSLSSVALLEGALTLVLLTPYVFNRCYSLTSFTFPNGALTLVTSINGIFLNCSSLTYITFPEGALTQVKDMNAAFRLCSVLTSLSFPQGALTLVTNIFNSFYYCFSLTSLTFPEGALTLVKSIDGAFYYCSVLTSIVFPEGALTQVTGLKNTFFQCFALQDLTIYNLPNINLTNIGFSYCKLLTLSSLQNIVNALPETNSGYKCTLGTTNLSKLSEEQIAIATNKGWTLN